MQAKTTYEDLKNLIIGRGAIYEYLSLVFRDVPNKNFLGISCRYAAAFAELGKERETASLTKGAALLARYAYYESTNPPETVLNRLGIEYTGLFLIGSAGVNPTESVNRTPERMSRQEPWAEVVNVYRQRGFKVSPDFKEPEDHISMELLFMQRMCELTADLIADQEDEKAEKVLKEQAEFINGHLKLWVPDFCAETAAMAARNGSVLYEAAALLLNGFLSLDSATVDYLLD